jgi:hypothetical protein
MIARGDARYPGSHLYDDTGPLVSQYERVRVHGHRSIDQVIVRMTQTGSLDLDQHLALARAGDLDFIDLEGLIQPDADCGP